MAQQTLKRQRKPPLTEAERAQILALHAESVSTHEISKRVGRARGTIRGFLKDPQAYGLRRCRSGRRSKIDASTQRFIIHEARKGTKTYAQIVDEAPIKMSVRTLQRFLRKCSDQRSRSLATGVSEESSTDSDSGDGDGNSDSSRTAKASASAEDSAAASARAAVESDRHDSDTNALHEPTPREIMQLMNRRFDALTQTLVELVEGQRELVQLLKGRSSSSSAQS